MIELDGKAAVITGGASGIGLALARAFTARGAQVTILDVEAEALEAALADVRRGAPGVEVRGAVCDVVSREAVQAAARDLLAEVGRIDIVCANAGVGGAPGRLHTRTEQDWRWTLGVNLMGMVHTVDAFLPHLLGQGSGQVVYTASMAGLLTGPQLGAYSASKFATVAMAETLAAELAGSGVSVAVLCPGFVSTRIHESARNRVDEVPGGGGEDAEIAALTRHLVTSGMAAEVVAERVIEAMAAGDFYIFTHPQMRPFVEQRFDRIRQGFDAAERSGALAKAALPTS